MGTARIDARDGRKAPIERWWVATVAVLVAVATILVGTPTEAEAATVGIGGGFQARATGGGDGGIWTPHVTVGEGCEAWDSVRVERFSYVISRGDTVVTRGAREFELVRLKPGTYRVQSTATYVDSGRRATVSKSQIVEVTRKTDATSVSSSEYRQIRKGMTLTKVRKIVGGRGDYEAGYLFMESTRFEHSVGVRFSKGRVAEKWRTENVYDWC